MELFNTAELIYILRIFLASLCGAVIGLERERRFKGAGIRTHLIVALSAALMTVLSKYGFSDVVGGGVNVDASRVAAGVVSAIGFLGAGVIFFRRDIVSGVTTAAGLWATVGIGIAIGAGWYLTGAATTLMIVCFQMLLHYRTMLVSPQKAGTIVFRVKEGETEEAVLDRLARFSVRTRDVGLKRAGDGFVEARCEVIFPADYGSRDMIRTLRELPEVMSIEMHRP
ncbi:MAG: MgtC/SapB family protein [Butyricicoccus sp.]|nr:MgtC/SapB family protein [Butyricicoccus sp.]